MRRLGQLGITSVLLVDDDEEASAGWSANCAANWFELGSANNGKSALAMFVESAVDMVSQTGAHTGDVGERIRHQLRALLGLADVVFVLVAGKPSPPAFVSYDGFLRKPVDGQILLPTMRRLLAEHATHREQRRGGTT